MRESTSWVRRPLPRPGARVRLLCFPHAGGGASTFRSWHSVLPPEAELTVIQYPGREDRFGQPMVDEMSELVRQVCDELVPRWLDRPYVLVGHSMGAAAAYEVAQEIRRRGCPAPERLVVCARHAPTEPREDGVHRGNDDALVAELHRLGGTPQEVLADPELRRTVLEIVRNDYRLAETYTWLPAPPLDCPISVFVGDADPECDAEDGAGWAPMTTGNTEISVFPGDHFFLTPQRKAVVAALVRAIGPRLVPSAGTWPTTP